MTSTISRDIIQQPIEFVGDALPSELPDFVPEFGDVTDAIGDVVSTVATTGGKGVFRVVRTARRHPRGTGIVLLIVLAALGGAAFMKKRNDSDPQLITPA